MIGLVQWTYNDGGRKEAGHKGTARDCVCRTIAIATGMSYSEVSDLIVKYGARERPRNKRRSDPQTGVQIPTIRKILADLGWEWVPIMKIGSGTTVHLSEGEVPAEGRYILNLSRHMTALIDGVVHDTHDPSREGTRAVYGYWKEPQT